MIHYNVRRFFIEGETDDSSFVKIRDDQERYLCAYMREEGFVPSLDIGPHFSTSLNENGMFDYILSVYGVYVGSELAWENVAICEELGLIPSLIQNPKSNPSSEDAE